MEIAITLSAKLSRILAGTLKSTPDGRTIDAARREMREAAITHARKLLRNDPLRNIPDVAVYACDRYGGSLLEVVPVPVDP